MEAFLENSKYIEIVDTARNLFWKHGIKRVTVEEICRKADVSKMTFYKFFDNKVVLAKRLIDQLMQESFDQFNEVLNSEISFNKKMERIFFLKMEYAKQFGQEFVNDIYVNKSLGLMEYMQQYMIKARQMTIGFFRKSQEEGYLRSDVSIDFIMALGNKVQEMIVDEELMKNYCSPKDFIYEYMSVLFYGIIDKKR